MFDLQKKWPLLFKIYIYFQIINFFIPCLFQIWSSPVSLLAPARSWDQLVLLYRYLWGFLLSWFSHVHNFILCIFSYSPLDKRTLENPKREWKVWALVATSSNLTKKWPLLGYFKAGNLRWSRSYTQCHISTFNDDSESRGVHSRLMRLVSGNNDVWYLGRIDVQHWNTDAPPESVWKT